MNIGRYEVTHELGRGGMAIVYLARDPLVKRQVAVKVLPRQFTFDPQFRTRFQREAEVVATLEHPSIVPVYDFGEHEGQPFIVMRYMAGGSLANRLGRGPLPPAEAATLFERVGAAVDHAHSHGVIHRDIKPGNILFDAQGNVYLSDFGIAKISEATAAFTGTGGIVGTPAYMSPEQVQGDKAIDGRCDVYSLGVVLFESLSGQVPYKADTPMGAAFLHVTEPIPSLLARQPNLPPAFEAVIRRALEKDPARRFQTATELARGIQQVMRGGTVVEPLPGTFVERAGATYVEPAGVPAPRMAPASQTANRTYSTTAPPPARKLSVPILMAVGAGILAVCVLVGLAGGIYTGMIPNPFASAAAATATVPIAEVIPTGTTAPVEAASSPTPPATLFVPVGLSTTYIEYIFDASGSMLAAMDGTTRLVVAQQVLTSRLQTLPDGTQVGLRVYGHRVPWQGREAESCADIELVTPIQANGADSIIAWLPGMQALGMTPMSESISQAANDFTFEPGRRNFIVLLSDGEETCGDDPATVVQFLKEIGVDFAIHVIGLDVDANTAAQLSGIADAGGGVYYDARSGADLDAALGNINSTILPSDLPAETPTPAASDTPTLVPTATLIPAPNAEIASEGVTTASSIYDSTYPTYLATDNYVGSAWFSAGPERDGTTTFTWTGVQDDFIGSIEVISNRSLDVTAFRTGYGFGEVTVQVLDALGNVVYEEVVNLAGTPDPDVEVTPNVVGRSIRLIFTGSEAFDCGGFAELYVWVVR